MEKILVLLFVGKNKHHRSFTYCKDWDHAACTVNNPQIYLQMIPGTNSSVVVDE